MSKYTRFLKTKWSFLALGLLFGAIVILGIRVAAYSPPKGTHYHANFAVYINGQREPFEGMNYYEETAATSCSISEAEAPENTPMSRVHLHGNVNDVVHVEDSRVTWGNLFTVLGWNVGNDYVATRNAIYQNNDQSKVTYILNGKKANDISNVVISDQDKLLVNYGNQASETVQHEYDGIQNKALKSDQSKDPASCGSHGNSTTMKDRLQHMF